MVRKTISLKDKLKKLALRTTPDKLKKQGVKNVRVLGLDRISQLIREAVDRKVEAIVISMPYDGRYGAYSIGETVPYVLNNAPCRVILCRDQRPAPVTNERDR